MDELNKVDDVKTNDTVKYNKLWYVEFIKGGEDYQIKKISEHKSEVIGYNPNTNKITFKEGIEIASFKTFKDAAIVAIARKISKKKEKWDEVILFSVLLLHVCAFTNELFQRQITKNNANILIILYCCFIRIQF